MSHRVDSSSLKDIDDPLPSADTTATASEPSKDQISTLQEMGFSEAQAKKALKETVKYYDYISIVHTNMSAHVEQ